MKKKWGFNLYNFFLSFGHRSPRGKRSYVTNLTRDMVVMSLTINVLFFTSGRYTVVICTIWNRKLKSSKCKSKRTKKVSKPIVTKTKKHPTTTSKFKNKYIPTQTKLENYLSHLPPPLSWEPNRTEHNPSLQFCTQQQVEVHLIG